MKRVISKRGYKLTADIGKTTFTERVNISLALTQKQKQEVAEAAEMGAPALSRWIKGKSTSPSLDSLKKFAKVCGVSPGWLASGEGDIRK